MIIFETLEYRNFKAVGNDPVKINFTESKTTLVTGSNGAGKSTIISALCFALFGQDLFLNKNLLINSINQKQCEVILNFTIGQKKYKIIRSIKPNVFKIFEDEKLINEDSNVRDYQKILETQILKMNIRSFKQVVMLGGRKYVPFMDLKISERRDFIEDLLDIKIFSTMNSLLKDSIKFTKEQIKEKEHDLKSIKEKLKLQENFIKKLTDEKNLSSDKIKAAIEKLQSKIDEDKKTEQQLYIDKGLLIEEKRNYDVSSLIVEKITSCSHVQNDINKKQKNVSFYEDNIECPTCKQEIEDSHKEVIIKESTQEIRNLETELEQLKNEIIMLKEQKQRFQELEDSISKIDDEMYSLQKNILSNQKIIESGKTQLEELNTSNDSIKEEKQKLKLMLLNYISVEKDKKILIEDQEYYNIIQTILSDGGIKSKIIEQYIPTINKLIYKYLNVLGYWVKFELDSEFNETIKSRYRDTFKYENFSGGQAARIDLALMLTWRDIARMRNAVNVNICMFDEADAFIDSEGSELLLDMLKSLDKSNIFLISHKSDLLKDKVDRVIEFELHNNFTRLKLN